MRMMILDVNKQSGSIITAEGMQYAADKINAAPCTIPVACKFVFEIPWLGTIMLPVETNAGDVTEDEFTPVDSLSGVYRINRFTLELEKLLWKWHRLLYRPGNSGNHKADGYVLLNNVKIMELKSCMLGNAGRGLINEIEIDECKEIK